jgi:stage II sporulation protein AA (anti-sigma F factor antagonist)
MEIQTQQNGNVLVVAVSGRLDAVTAPDYEIKIRSVIDAGHHNLVIDFAKLEYISSAGLRGLLLTAKLLKAQNGQVYLANPDGNVKSVFDMSGFSALFKMADSLDAALAALP